MMTKKRKQRKMKVETRQFKKYFPILELSNQLMKKVAMQKLLQRQLLMNTKIRK